MFAHSRELTQNGSSTSRIHVRSTIMSETATMTTKQTPLQYVTEQLKEMREKGVAPKLRVLEGEQKPVCLFDGREVINLASNNYLGLTTHKTLRKAALDAVKRYGVGAGAVRTIAGTMRLHMELEEQIAAFKNVEACVVFQSGFTANAGTVSAVLGKEDLIISEELNHASIIDGARLSKATIKVFKHKDVKDCERILQENANFPGKKLIITDGVFSMDGDIAPLPELCELAEKYNCIMMVDDAHASGVLGRGGRGTVDHHQCHGGGLPGGFRAARFSGRRKASEETLGQYEVFQARIEEARFSVQGERDADYSDSRGRRGEGVRILQETLRGRRLRAGCRLPDRGGRQSAAARHRERGP